MSRCNIRLCRYPAVRPIATPMRHFPYPACAAWSIAPEQGRRAVPSKAQLRRVCEQLPSWLYELSAGFAIVLTDNDTRAARSQFLKYALAGNQFCLQQRQGCNKISSK